MAGDWIKLESNTSRKPKVLRMARLLSLNRWDVVGRLSDIWAWADQHTVDGRDLPIEDDDIDSMVECEGFAKAMRSVDYLGGQPGRLFFPNWEQHNTLSAKARALEAEAKRIRRQMEEVGRSVRSVSDTVSDNRGHCADESQTNGTTQRPTRDESGTGQGGGSAGAGARVSTPGASGGRKDTTTTPSRGAGPNPPADDVPFAQIVSAWAELCPELKPVRVRTPARDAAIATFWQFCAANMENVRAVFTKVGRSNLLNGRPHRTKKDRRPYKTYFDKVIHPDLAARIVEGHFDDEPEP